MPAETADWVGLHLENGRYRVTARLGQGGMGLVLLARDTKLDTDVVVKLLHRALLHDALASVRFQREIRALVSLSHPHIVKVHDVGEHGGVPFIVMQYLPGGNLHRRLCGADRRVVAQPPEWLHAWLPDVADALDYIHRKGYLHRDVKPHNILLDAEGTAYVSDFGLVRAAGGDSSALTGTGQPLGTPQYLAPEVMQGGDYDGRVDQYSLAVTVYQWLCGRLPFDGPVAMILVEHLTREPPPPSRWAPALPAETEAALLRALAKDPGRRFADCAAFARALLAPVPRRPLADPSTTPTAPMAAVTAEPTPPSGPTPAADLQVAELLPPREGVSRVACPVCRTPLKLRGSAAGKRTKCPACRTPFRVPTDLPTTPTPILAAEFVNSAGMKLVLVPPGKFLMGSPPDEDKRQDDEEQHPVEILRPFHLGAHPVTQEQYENVTGKNPSHFSPGGAGAWRVQRHDTRRFPVENVSWEDATEFCARLSELPDEKAGGRTYRLPTEAQWEYACRGGAAEYAPFHFGRVLTWREANFNGIHPYGTAEKGLFPERTSEVGSFPPNAWGLYDLHGNVWEWCADWYDAGYYKTSPRASPQGPRSSPVEMRVLRGGCWFYDGRFCRSACRNRSGPRVRSAHNGFRVVCVIAAGAT